MTVTGAGSAVWSGSWAAERLGIQVLTEVGVGGLVIEDLVGMALRINPRRAHLLVSRVLGKHVPADPRLILGAGRLLGALVADRLSGRDTGIADAGGSLLAAALSGASGAAPSLLALCNRHLADGPIVDALVLGYAETATGLGHAVADAIDADYLHSTRRDVPGVAREGAFEEAHSHATQHLLLPEDPLLLANPRPLVLVDDELSTGATVMDTIRAVQRVARRDRFVVASLVDLRSRADRQRLHDFARQIGIRLDVVTLVSGQIRLPEDAVVRGQALTAAHGRRPLDGSADRTRGRGAAPTIVVPPWPEGVRDGGRHGFPAAERTAFDAAVRAAADALLPGVPTGVGARVLVLGTEELMYLPLRLAAALVDRMPVESADVWFSSTTRSPVVPVDEPGCAIRTVLTFDSHDRPIDGPGRRYAYNVAQAAEGDAFDAAVLVVDDMSCSWPEGGGGLPDRLAEVIGGPVIVLIVPSYRPSTAAETKS
ncbi:phosphoribosyltransferase family protein [Geodermatophilus sp. SYSU D00691]